MPFRGYNQYKGVFMKKVKIFANVIFWLTVISPMIAFSASCLIGEVEVFGVMGIVRYSWVMWLFMPLGILSMFFGAYLKKRNQKYKRYIIVAIICLSLLLIFGSYRFVFSDASCYDTDQITSVEEKIGIDFPDSIKIATEKFDAYSVSYVKITSAEEKTDFESAILKNPLWKDELGTKITSLLPQNLEYEIIPFDYFVFYNVTSGEYNTYPENGEYECVFVAYDKELQRFIVLNEFVVNLN